MREQEVTKILFLDHDETTFQFRKCMAKVLGALPPVELFHAADATEALQLMEQLQPDVIVLDDDNPAERDLFLDSLTGNHPPIVLEVEDEKDARHSRSRARVTLVRKGETLEGIHQTLIVATNVATRPVPGNCPKMPI